MDSSSNTLIPASVACLFAAYLSTLNLVFLSFSPAILDSHQKPIMATWSVFKGAFQIKITPQTPNISLLVKNKQIKKSFSY
jgi:hypothetical protein